MTTQKHIKTRLLALLLVLIMLFGLMPTAMAADTLSSIEESSIESTVDEAAVDEVIPDDTSQMPDADSSTEQEVADTGSSEISAAESVDTEADADSNVVIYTDDTSETEDETENDEAMAAYEVVSEALSTTGYSLLASSLTGTVPETDAIWFSTSWRMHWTDNTGAEHLTNTTWMSSHYMQTNGSKIPVYCIEPTVSINHSGTYTGGSTGYAWDSRQREAQRTAITLALAYAYPNQTYSSISYTQNYSVTDDGISLMALTAEETQILGAQLLVWEFVTGQRSTTYPYTKTLQSYADSDSKFADSSFSWYPAVLEVRDAIVEKMVAETEDIPSFSYSSESAAKNDAYTLEYDASSNTYKLTLTDSEGVLSDYDFSSSVSGLTFSRSGNKLTITATPEAAAKIGTSGVTAAAVGPSVDPYGTSVVVWTLDDSQTLINVDDIEYETAYVSLRVAASGSLTLVKKSTNSEMVANNTCYSLAGTTYDLYSDSSCTTKVGTFTVNADGTSNTITGLTAGTYYYKELTAGTGYTLDSTVYSTTVTAGETNTITAYDKPSADPFYVEITKVNAESTSYANPTPLSMAGAKFSITYYSGYYTTEAAAESAVSAGTVQKRTWYMTTVARTSGSTTKYIASTEYSTPEGDDLFYDDAGSIVVPHGTIVVKEVSAPTGYTNSADFYLKGSTTSYGTSVVIQYDGSNKAKDVVTGNYMDELSMTVYETSIYGGVSVQKVDADTSSNTAQGDASLAGAVFGIYNDSDYAVYINGKEYAMGALVTTITTDSSGYAATASDALPYGDYYLKEITAPTGYQLSSVKKSFSITKSSTVVSLGNYSDTAVKGTIQLTKSAVNTVTGDTQAEAGATFQVWLKSAGSYAKADASARDVITIGEDGTGTSKALPYGTYCVQQVSGWDGYDLDETVYEVTISTNGAVVTKDTSGNALNITNDIWTGTITIVKQDGDTQEPLSGAEFTLTGDDGSKVVAVTDSAGKVVFENLYYGVTYTWTETGAPKGYLLNEKNTGTWSVEEHDAAITITCDNYRRPGSITVTKQDSSGNPLAGCTFLLEYLDGTTWRPVTYRSADPITKGGTTSNVTGGCLTTGSDGTVTFSGLWADDELQYRLTEVGAPDGYTLLSEPIFKGVLPVSYADGEVSATPDEVISGTAYFYDLPVTVRDGRIYTLPLTGGSSFPFVPMALLALVLGALLLGWSVKKRKGANHLKHNFLKRIGTLAMTAVMALSLTAGASAADEANATIDTSRSTSLTVYKYDLTNAENDGVWETDSYVSTGIYDETVDETLSPYAIQGVEFSYLKIADLYMLKENEDTEHKVMALYGFLEDVQTNSKAVTEFLDALGLSVDDAYTVKYDSRLNRIWYFQSDTLIDALADALETNSTNTKAALEAYIAANGGTAMPETDANGKSSVDGLDQGLYLVVETRVPENVTSTTVPFLVSLPMTTVDGDGWNYDVTVFPKNHTGSPNLEKTVREAKADTGKNDGTTNDITDGYDHTATASDSDVLDYQIISTLPTITSPATALTTYTFVDNLSKGIQYNKNDVKIEFFKDAACTDLITTWTEADGKFNVSYSSYSTLTGTQMTISMTEAGLEEINDCTTVYDRSTSVLRGYSDCTLRITYTCTVNSDAVTVYGDSGNPNDVTLTWKRTNTSYYDTLSDCCHVYTYGMELTKQFSDNKGKYENVTFLVHNTTDGYYVQAELNEAEGIYYVTGHTAKEAEATLFKPMSGDINTGKVIVMGLEDDTYVITEVATDSGYKLLKENITVEITASKGSEYCPLCGTALLTASAKVNGSTVTMTENNGSVNAIVPFTVVNTKGFTLPKTGGDNDMTPYAIGGVLALAGIAVVIAALATKKKKNQA